MSIGVAAHITAASAGGPRFDPTLTAEQRQAPENGIHLCNNCSRIVDGDEVAYSAALLRNWKRKAEAAAAIALGAKRGHAAPVVAAAVYIGGPDAIRISGPNAVNIGPGGIVIHGPVIRGA